MQRKENRPTIKKFKKLNFVRHPNSSYPSLAAVALGR